MKSIINFLVVGIVCLSGFFNPSDALALSNQMKSSLETEADSFHFKAPPFESMKIRSQKVECKILDGALSCSGDNSFGQLQVPNRISNIKDVFVSERNVCIIERQGLKCWGELFGEDALKVSQKISSQVKHPRQVIATEHSLCILDGQTPRCWIGGMYGSFQEHPSITHGLSNVAAIYGSGTDMPNGESGTSLDHADTHVCFLINKMGLVCRNTTWHAKYPQHFKFYGFAQATYTHEGVGGIIEGASMSYFPTHDNGSTFSQGLYLYTKDGRAYRSSFPVSSILYGEKPLHVGQTYFSPACRDSAAHKCQLHKVIDRKALRFESLTEVPTNETFLPAPPKAPPSDYACRKEFKDTLILSDGRVVKIQFLNQFGLVEVKILSKAGKIIKKYSLNIASNEAKEYTDKGYLRVNSENKPIKTFLFPDDTIHLEVSIYAEYKSKSGYDKVGANFSDAYRLHTEPGRENLYSFYNHFDPNPISNWNICSDLKGYLVKVDSYWDSKYSLRDFLGAISPINWLSFPQPRKARISQNMVLASLSTDEVYQGIQRDIEAFDFPDEMKMFRELFNGGTRQIQAYWMDNDNRILVQLIRDKKLYSAYLRVEDIYADGFRLD